MLKRGHNERNIVDHFLGVGTDAEKLDPMTSRIENGVEYKSMAWWYVMISTPDCSPVPLI